MYRKRTLGFIRNNKSKHLDGYKLRDQYLDGQTYRDAYKKLLSKYAYSTYVNVSQVIWAWRVNY